MSIRVDESAKIYGKLEHGENVYIAQGTIIRSEDNSISIGNNSFILENSVVIGTRNHKVRIGSKIVFGHKCVVIGSEIGDLCEIGNGCIFLEGSKIGNNCIFGEGTIIPKGSVIPDNSVVIGRPYRIIRNLTEEDKEMVKRMRGGDISLSVVSYKTYNGLDWRDKTMGKLNALGGKYPEVGENSIIVEGAEVNGDVKIGYNSMIFSGVKIIGNSHGPVVIGDNVRILENTVLHLLPDNQLILEDNVVIGPGCIIHGCTIGEGSIIESGSIICDYSKIGSNSLVKSGTLVKQRSEFEDNKVLEGFPAKIVGEITYKLDRPKWA